MRKINSLLNNNSELGALSGRLDVHTLLQQLWCAAAPALIVKSSHVATLDNGLLTIYADNAAVANKIKLTHASLLMQLQNLQKNTPTFRECKVTAIAVKVQVKSRVVKPQKTSRHLSPKASASLKKLINELGESPLTMRLQALVNQGESAK